VFGPNLASATRDLLPQPFTGAYLALVAVAGVALGLISLIPFPPLPTAAQTAGGRPLREIARQPVFIIAVAAAALGYGVMNLLMAATPLAMQQCGLPFGDAATVLQWHVVGMFAPGFFTGHIIKRFGALPVMGAGVALNLACIAIALSGLELQQFGTALFLLGLGWNFLFTGATTLSLSTYRHEEKDRAQAVLNFFMFATLAVTSLASGVLVTTQGWTWLNLGSLLPVGVVAGGLAWLAFRSARPATA
jgi:predicted MFS family arabinose efflux permease